MSAIRSARVMVDLVPILLHWTYILWSPQSHSSDTLDVLQAELRNGFPSLLLVTRVDCHRSTSWNVGFSTGVDIRLGAIACVFNIGSLLLRLVRELFNARVRHFVALILGPKQQSISGDQGAIDKIGAISRCDIAGSDSGRNDERYVHT